jgi:hypothetical protein
VGEATPAGGAQERRTGDCIGPIAVDVSEDVAPSRLAKARQKIVDALRLRQEGSTGLVA